MKTINTATTPETLELLAALRRRSPQQARLKRLEETFTARALRAYFRRFGAEADQPASPASVDIPIQTGRRCYHLILENIHGELARYRITAKGCLRFVEPS